MKLPYQAGETIAIGIPNNSNYHLYYEFSAYPSYPLLVTVPPSGTVTLVAEVLFYGMRPTPAGKYFLGWNDTKLSMVSLSPVSNAQP